MLFATSIYLFAFVFNSAFSEENQNHEVDRNHGCFSEHLDETDFDSAYCLDNSDPNPCPYSAVTNRIESADSSIHSGVPDKLGDVVKSLAAPSSDEVLHENHAKANLSSRLETVDSPLKSSGSTQPSQAHRIVNLAPVISKRKRCARSSANGLNDGANSSENKSTFVNLLFHDNNAVSRERIREMRRARALKRKRSSMIGMNELMNPLKRDDHGLEQNKSPTISDFCCCTTEKTCPTTCVPECKVPTTTSKCPAPARKISKTGAADLASTTSAHKKRSGDGTPASAVHSKGRRDSSSNEPFRYQNKYVHY